MIVMQSDQAEGLRHSNRGHRPRQVISIEPSRPVRALLLFRATRSPQRFRVCGKIRVYQCPSVVKKAKFAKRTQIENHKTLQINWMRKTGLASFSKRTHFPFASFVVQTLPFKAFQRISNGFKAIQRFFRKKIICVLRELRELHEEGAPGYFDLFRPIPDPLPPRRARPISPIAAHGADQPESTPLAYA
jgi:hypothetical protein